MPSFRIAIGYKTEHRRSTPVVLGASIDPAALQAAIDAAPADILRTEIGTFFFQRRGKRSNSSVKVSSVPAEPALDPGSAGDGDAEALPAAEVADEAPSLPLPETGPRKKPR